MYYFIKVQGTFIYIYFMIFLYTKNILLILFISLTLTIKAQVTKIDTVNIQSLRSNTYQFKSHPLYLYTIGLKAFSIEEFPKILNQINSDDFTTTFMNGVLLKINDNQISYRLVGNYYSKNITFKNECEECEEANGKLKDFSATIGFEKNFIYGIIQPYFAFDVGYRRSSFNGEVKNATALNYTDPYAVTTLKNGFLLSPNFGLKVNLLTPLTLVAETGIGFLYNYEKQEKVYRNLSRPPTFQEYKKWEFLLKPVSMLSLQYNLGLTY